MSMKTRILSLLGAATLTTAIACADSTAPQAAGTHPLRDTTVLQGDSTLCRNGWEIVDGRIVCNEEQ
jgi:hypothetical protein